MEIKTNLEAQLSRDVPPITGLVTKINFFFSVTKGSVAQWLDQSLLLILLNVFPFWKGVGKRCCVEKKHSEIALLKKTTTKTSWLYFFKCTILN